MRSTFNLSPLWSRPRLRKIALLVLVLAGASLACNLPLPTSEPQTPFATPQPSPHLPATGLPSPLPSPDLTQEPGVANPICVPFQAAADLPAVDFASYPQAILDFLNAGGSIEALDEALYQAGVANQPIAAAALDMTGDKKQEVLVSIFDPASRVVPPSGELLIYVCQEGVYRLLHRQDSPQAGGAPGIRFLQDLNTDGRAELVAGAPTCGASTCFEDIQVLGWNGEGFDNLLSGSTLEIPAPVINLLDPDGDGVYELEVAGGGFGSAGAGPQRSESTVWIYNPQTGRWQDPQKRLESSNYRIHVLQDADRAALERRFPEALNGYSRVAEDASLADWLDPPTEQANLAAYALFRTALAHLLLEQADQAQAAFQRQEADFPPGTVGRAYAEMAQAFRAAYGAGGIPSGCAAARQYAAEHPQEVLVPLGSPVYGYANPDYAPQDICPWE